MIRVLIISPGLATRVGLRTLLMDDPRIQVMGEAASPDDLEGRQTEVDVVLWSPGSSIDQESHPMELQRTRLDETAAVLMIYDDPKVIGTLARQNKHGWGLLSPEATKEEIITAINAVNEGLVVTNPLWLGYLSIAQTPDRDEDTEIIEALTGREVEILQLMAQGLTNKQIAVKLGISAHTVKFHVSSIFGKMGTTNRTETVKLGLQKGLILL